MQSILLNVEGLSCSHCENAVKKAVGVLDGVKKVEVYLKDKTVQVDFEPDSVSINQIKEAIDDQGYEVV